MDVQDPRIRLLLRQADKVADSGKRAAAEQLYRQLIEEDSAVPEAWFGLGQMVNGSAEQEAAFEKALSLKPDFAAAARALAELREQPIPEWAEAVEPEEEAEPEPIQREPEVEERHTAVSEIDDYALACYRHPNRPTALRCYNCGKPICSSCAIKTPVGYSCPDCIREKEGIFFNAQPFDYVIAPLIGLTLSLVVGWLVATFASGGGIFVYFIMLFVGGVVGRFIGRLSKAAIGRRRGRYLPHIMVAMLIFGTLIWLLPSLFIVFAGGLSGLFIFLGPGIYLFAASGALFSYMK